MPEVCVVHLVWAPLGPAALRRFAISYRGHSAGMDHRLVFVFKDFASPSKIVIFRKDDRGATQKLRFNYNRAIGSGDEPNMMLVSGDVVVVP